MHKNTFQRRAPLQNTLIFLVGYLSWSWMHNTEAAETEEYYQVTDYPGISVSYLLFDTFFHVYHQLSLRLCTKRTASSKVLLASMINTNQT